MRALLAIVLACLAGVAWADESPDQFAYAMPVEAPAGSGLLRLTLPAEIYAGSARAGLADVRVFDRHGKAVPFAFEPRTESTARESWTSVPAYPMYSSGAVRLEQSKFRLASRGVTMEVEVTGNTDGGGSPRRLLRGYVLDVSGVKTAMTGMAFDWRHEDHALVVVSVERSNDLDHWQPVSGEVTLARLTAQGQSLVRNEIEFSAAPAKYLRVTFPRAEPAPSMQAIRLRVSEDAPAPPRQWQEFDGHSAEGTGLEFDLAGALPVDRIQLQLQGANAVVPVEVLSRAKPADAWNLVVRHTFYRIEHSGLAVANPDLQIGPTRQRYWRVRAVQSDGVLPIKALRAGWLPERLVFVTQGEAPFRLVYGNARAQPVALPIASLVPGYGSDQAPRVADASLGVRQVLAGEDAKVARVEPKTYALWGALGLGVLLLAWMALSLIRQLKQPPR